MNFPFKKDEHSQFISIKFEFSVDDMGDGVISVMSEGAGAFVEINAAGGLRLNVEELEYLAYWARELCDELDRYNGEWKK